ncbi:MAG: hypothetical protein ACYC3L_01215 [Gemmatimonadaceae bacterium]
MTYLLSYVVGVIVVSAIGALTDDFGEDDRGVTTAVAILWPIIPVAAALWLVCSVFLVPVFIGEGIAWLIRRMRRVKRGAA